MFWLLEREFARVVEALRWIRHPSGQQAIGATVTGSLPSASCGVISELETRAMEGSAESNAAVCRFCLETELTDASPEDARLVSTCNCRGTSAMVHLGCLRRWQASGVGHRLTPESLDRAATCGVCGAKLVIDGVQLRPQIADVVLSVGVGTLLVATANLTGEGRTFHHSVILICEYDASGGRVRGIDLTRRFDEVPGFPEGAAVFSGGPVCGGRLGVVQYVMLRTTPDAAHSKQVPLKGRDERPVVLYCPDPWEGYDTQRAMSYACHALAERRGCNLRMFRGHAAWGRGQLEAEIYRGNWAVCQGSISDVEDIAPEELWSELHASGRLAHA